jgi:hypothetical protein
VQVRDMDGVQAKTLKCDQGEPEETSVIGCASPNLRRQTSTHFLQTTQHTDHQSIAEELEEHLALRPDSETLSEEYNLDLSKQVHAAQSCTLSGGFWSAITGFANTEPGEDALEHSIVDDSVEIMSIESPSPVGSPQVPAASHGSACDHINSPEPNYSGNPLLQGNASCENC